MGIADLWPILSSSSDERVPFPVFLSQFLKENGRPPRFAIDAYMFMFWSQLPDTEAVDPAIERRIIRNFMAKLWYLVLNNVSFVVVFDGKFKPGKLRNGHVPDAPSSSSYNDVLHYFLKLHASSYSEGSGLVERFKVILSRNRIDWVQAPAEAEAECAWLQKLGVVDYVISDDSDTLVFGATRVLRSFNRVKYYTDEGDPVLSSTDYYVTPVDMAHITLNTNLTRNRLVFIAILRGGDYSKGSEDIGITRAKEIALCGTTLLSNLPRKAMQDFGSFPDFTKMFVDTFLEPEHDLAADPFEGMKSEIERSENLTALNNYLDEFLRTDGKKIFGRTTSLKSKLQIDDFYALLYFFPLVNTRVFKFTPHSVSFGETKAIDNDLVASTTCNISRINGILSASVIGSSVYVDGGWSFIPKTDLTPRGLVLPRERKYNLKAFVLKFLRDPSFWAVIQFSRIKQFEGVPLVVLKFNRIKLNDFVYLVRKEPYEAGPEELKPEPAEEDEPDAPVSEPAEDVDEKLLTAIVTLESVRHICPSYEEEIERLQKLKRSPQRKKLPPQKTTLDTIWPQMSPQKPKAQSPSRPPLPSPTRLAVKKEKDQIKGETSNSKMSPSTSPKTSPKISPQRTGNTVKPPKHSRAGIPVLSRSESSTLAPPTSELSPKKSPRRRRSQKQGPLPGQSTVTSFFSPKKAMDPFQKTDPFQDSLFVDSDFEQDSKSFMQTSNLENVHYEYVPSESEPSSQETSPKKKSRMDMTLSANTSPLKQKREIN